MLNRPAIIKKMQFLIDSIDILRNQGLKDKTIKLYEGRVRAFLDYSNSSDPDAAIADKLGIKDHIVALYQLSSIVTL
jgi:hypothetical protein